MNPVLNALSAALVCLAASSHLFAQAQADVLVWDKSTAIKTIDRSQAMESLKPIFEMARSGNETGLLRALSDVSSDPDLPDPARDYLVYKFTLGLGDLEAGAVSPKVIDWLTAYQPATWVAHQEHPRTAIPLFNVRSAAQGVNNGWERQKASVAAQRILAEKPERFIPAYLAASRAGQRGYIDAIEGIPPEPSAELSRLALEQLAASPELTHVATRAAIQSGDLKLLRRSIALGEGPGLTRALKDASAVLSADESAELLQYAMENEPDSKAALAMALVAPGRLDEPAIRDLMFNALADKRLGASAALVLGNSPDPEIQFHLSEIAAGKEGLEKQRAQMAIGFKPAGRVD